MQIVKSIINGYWYETSFIDDIKKTKSPYKSQNSLANIVELDIDTSQIEGDSLFIDAPSVHEGTSFTIYFRPGVTATSFPTSIIDYDNENNFYELEYNITSNDTSLIIYHYDKSKRLIGQTKYLKTKKNTEGAFQYMVNKTLIAGDYRVIDTPRQSEKIWFSNDGIVKGFSGYATYHICTDFVAGPLNNLDQLCLAPDSDWSLCYAYEINGDTLKLYETIESEDHISLKLGQLKFRLLRQ